MEYCYVGVEVLFIDDEIGASVCYCHPNLHYRGADLEREENNKKLYEGGGGGGGGVINDNCYPSVVIIADYCNSNNNDN